MACLTVELYMHGACINEKQTTDIRPAQEVLAPRWMLLLLVSAYSGMSPNIMHDHHMKHVFRASKSPVSTNTLLLKTTHVVHHRHRESAY